jgi:thiol-disulfide isomerase/thioredoxin
MKKIIAIFSISFGLMTSAHAQTPYTSTVDNQKVLILNGLISKYALENNPAFSSWYPGNKNAYTPPAEVLNAMEAAKGKFQFLLFGGTWCEDTQSVLPKFFKLQEQSGVADKDISFFAVDRQKQTLGNISGTFKITNVPTIIVLKDGKEVGRVVEYGKTGKWDEELAALLK